MGVSILPEEIINQIAAGEVIENPAAVIKELIENAIDAKANSISISLEESGLKKIVVKDNGVGMEEEDLLKAPLRHATSKITSFEDLYSINTMGFRGEALASIFSIANTTITTKTPNTQIGLSLSSLKPDTISQQGCSQGTTITVEELFYNTPARKKYLKSNTLELKDILNVVKRFELSYPNIEFHLKHNNTQLIHKPAFSNQKENISYVLGKEVKNKLLEVNYAIKGIQIKGFIANPTEISYSYKKNQYFFVNGRYIKSKLLNDALYQGFGSNLMVGKHPSFVLFIEIDPEIIDVNVHPTKTQIRFENESEIFDVVNKAINQVFESQDLFKEFEQKEVDSTLDVEVNEKPTQPKDNSSKYFTKDFQKNFEVQEENIDYQPSEKTSPNSLETKPETSLPQELGPLNNELDEYKILGQLDKTYILVETKTGLLLVDQHVAEEKFFYEKMLHDSKHGATKQQQLLKPYIIYLDRTEMQDYKEYQDLLSNLGFEHEPFGTNEIAIRAVPVTLGHKINHPERFKEILHSILGNKTIKCVEEEHHAKTASIACRSAVMAGDELTYPQMKKIVENLKYLKQPFQCPHGRPTFLKYDFKDLEKKFKRIV